MKKIKLLMPILGLTSIATITIPLTSCGCGSDQSSSKTSFNMTYQDEYDGYAASDCAGGKKLKLVANKEYSFTLSTLSSKMSSVSFFWLTTNLKTTPVEYEKLTQSNLIKVTLNNQDVTSSYPIDDGMVDLEAYTSGTLTIKIKLSKDVECVPHMADR